MAASSAAPNSGVEGAKREPMVSRRAPRGDTPSRDEFGQPGRRCSIPIDRFSTPTGGSYVGCMVAQGVSKDCIFNEDFRYVFKSAVGAVAYELR